MDATLRLITTAALLIPLQVLVLAPVAGQPRLPSHTLHHQPLADARGRVTANSGFTVCRITSKKVWLRKSGNFRTVGAKPTTTCRVPVTSIEQNTQLEHRVLGMWLPASDVFTAYETFKRLLIQKEVEVSCVGRNLTKWRAVTWAVVIFHGRVFRAGVSTDEVELRCSV